MLRTAFGPAELVFEDGVTFIDPAISGMSAEIPGGLDYGTWHLYTVTLDSQADTMNIYYDGQLIGSEAWTTPIMSVDAPVTIGMTSKDRRTISR